MIDQVGLLRSWSSGLLLLTALSCGAQDLPPITLPAEPEAQTVVLIAEASGRGPRRLWALAGSQGASLTQQTPEDLQLSALFYTEALEELALTEGALFAGERCRSCALTSPNAVYQNLLDQEGTLGDESRDGYGGSSVDNG